jgi:AP-1 complex subunit mu
MSYRLSSPSIKPLVTLDVQVDRPSRSRVEYSVRARSHFKERSTASNVCVTLPLPADCTAPVCRATQGAAVYVPERSCLVWTVKHFPGGREFLLRCHFNLPSVEAEAAGGPGGAGGKKGSGLGGAAAGGGGLAARAGFAGARMPPAKVTLELPYYTASGLVVRYLRVVEKSGYQALPWVRYITSSTTEFRI